MTQSEFRLIFADQVNKCEETLRMKKKEYTGDHEDRLSAFKIAASLQDCTPQRALVGMMAKHKSTEPIFMVACIFFLLHA